MKKVLVTGLSGFIGSHTVDFLIEKEYKIHATSTQNRANTEYINWYQCNLLIEREVKELLNKIKPDYLLHLAWDVTPGKYMQSHKNYDWLIASINLLNCFKATGGQRAVFAGTQLEYIDNSPYPATKRALLEVLKSLNISYASGRVFNLFGENESPKRLVPYTIQSLINKTEVKYTSGDKELDFMYVKDVARAFVEILNSDIQGIVDIGSGKSIKIKDLVYMIAQLFDNIELVKFENSENRTTSNDRIIANIDRLKNEVGFVPEYNIFEAIKKIVEISKNNAKYKE